MTDCFALIFKHETTPPNIVAIGIVKPLFKKSITAPLEAANIKSLPLTLRSNERSNFLVLAKLSV